MVRFATLSAVVCAFVAAVSASPVASETLERRQSYTGRGTYFEVGLGACGYTDVDTDSIIAISHDIYNGGEYCNRYVEIKDDSTGITQYARVRDECMGCDADAIDMSPSLFQSFNEDLSVGVLTVTWEFMSEGWSP
ncbi:uncharacterized protein LAESUDRAFT_647059 [Laetiporus sulphureus 93-53]|uniref:RlpA-like protein double-psi beta-barrel domain-containing protein n=1 Tax=Laetiporus sulphureus 93-53 TaxID=1314785 RepID=A0A165FSN4_9APHY|nr:uncharacterized protein LAESUDRAFT_647059 [Laetiporus sulphureus 93-53]KZT09362.1 hypothetical protein LAESUDRAFT_647059 [Laetiporus sulphureus 93-53]